MIKIDTKILLAAVSIAMVCAGAPGIALILWVAYGMYKMDTRPE